MPIQRTLCAAAVIGFTLSAVSAQAFPGANGRVAAGESGTTLVMDGCGPFGHRNPFGDCRPNRGPRFYERRLYGEPGYGPRHFFGGDGLGRGYREGEFDRGDRRDQFRRDRFRHDDDQS